MAVEPKLKDIFGNSLEITDGEKQALGKDVEVFLRKILHVETHSRRGIVKDPKVLVISSSRCHILTQKPVKLETSFNFLKIKLLECFDNKLIFHLNDEPKPRELFCDKTGSIEIVSLILAQLKTIFPITPLDTLIKVSHDKSNSLESEIALQREAHNQGMEAVDPNSIESFITVYGFLCDLHGVPYLEDISSYLRAVYLTHGFRELKLSDFEHLSVKDLLPLISSVRHSQYFDGLSVDSVKLTPEIYEELGQTLIHSQTLKKLSLNNCSIRIDLLFQYCIAWKGSSKSVLTHLDLSYNPIEEKAVEHLCTAMESLQHGLSEVLLPNCKITPKVGSQLAQSMKKNQDLLYSLTKLDLSSNPLGPDPQAALVFIQEPQTITSLDLSKCGLNLEYVFPVLIRGCQQHLCELNLSQNKPKKFQAANVGQPMQQFFSSAISLKAIDLSDCKLTAELAIAAIEGLSLNPNIQQTKLDISFNELNHGLDVGAMANMLSRMKNVSDLDISNTGIDNHLARLLEAVGHNTTLRHLSVGQNFEGKGSARIDGIRQLCRLIKGNECSLISLNIANSKLKEYTPPLLHAMAINQSLRKIDISGNQMGSIGIRALVKLLLSGSLIEEVSYGNNDIPAVGFSYLADALEHNYTIKSLPTPVYDVAKVVGREGSVVEDALKRIQVYICRNHSDERLGIELDKRHQRRLLAASQQSALISREVIQLDELAEKISKTGSEASRKEIPHAQTVKEEANKVVQLVDGLYSPHQESKHYAAITERIGKLLEKEVEILYQEYVQENMERMVTQSVKACPTFLDDSTRETLRQIGSRELTEELEKAKKAVAKKTAPEIINHISGMNLETAAVISELIVDKTLGEVESCSTQLHCLVEKSSSSPVKKVTKQFTFRAKDQSSPKKKKAKKHSRHQSGDDSDDEILLPSTPLQSDGPVLQHLNKARPKPARKHSQQPPSALKQNTTTTSLWDTPTFDTTNEEPQSESALKLDQTPKRSESPLPPTKSPTPVSPVPSSPEPIDEVDTKTSSTEKPTSPSSNKEEPSKKKSIKMFGSKKAKSSPSIKEEKKDKSSSVKEEKKDKSSSVKEEKKEAKKEEAKGEKSASHAVEKEYVIVTPPSSPVKKAAEEAEHKEEKEGPKVTHLSGAGASLADVLKGGVPVQLKSTKPQTKDAAEGDDEKKPGASAPPTSMKPKRPSNKSKSPPKSPNKTSDTTTEENNKAPPPKTASKPKKRKESEQPQPDASEKPSQSNEEEPNAKIDKKDSPKHDHQELSISQEPDGKDSLTASSDKEKTPPVTPKKPKKEEETKEETEKALDGDKETKDKADT